MKDTEKESFWKGVSGFALIAFGFLCGFAFCAFFGLDMKRHASAPSLMVKSALNAMKWNEAPVEIQSSPEKKSTSDTLGECDAIRTETAKIADIADVSPIPVSDRAVWKTGIKEYKIFGLPVWKSKRIERD